MAAPSSADTLSASSSRHPRRVDTRFSTESAVVIAATALVIVRALPYLLFPQVAFDSDQAIVGLMAKHLAEGRAFPLFYYGLTYMLGVEAWAAAPFFVAAGPSVLALRLSLLAWNLVCAALLVVGLYRDGRLSPSGAFASALFFVAAPASVAQQLMTAQGGNIEPFVYIGVLWFLRRHPLWFGTVLAIGFRNREFTAYAVPVLVVLEVATGQMNGTRVRQWFMALAMFFAVWESIEALKPFADYLGPGTRGQLLGGFSGSQISNLTARFNWQPGELGERAARMTGTLVAWFSGSSQIDSSLPIGDVRWRVWGAALCALLGIARLIWLLTRRKGTQAVERTLLRRVRGRVKRAQLAFYLLGVGATALAVFVAARPGLEGYSRYALLGLLVPVGGTAALLRLESHRRTKQLVMGAAVAWGILLTSDHLRVLRAYVRDPPPDAARELVGHLVARHVAVASAGYWDAYLISFVADERVRVASNDVMRIQEYQDRFFESTGVRLRLSREACAGGTRVARWYLCTP